MAADWFALLPVLACERNCNCNYDDLYSTVSSKLLLGCFTRLLNIKAKSQISNKEEIKEQSLML